MEKCIKVEVDAFGNPTRLIEEVACFEPQEPSVLSQIVSDIPWWGLGVAILILLIVLWSLIGNPIWSVWAGKKEGEAKLAEANFAEQVAIAQARARLNSAQMNKEAEIVEAEAISQSIGTIGDALEKNPSYNRFQWIKMMEKSQNSTIYVPTEANLPILEAGRMKEKPKEEETE